MPAAGVLGLKGARPGKSAALPAVLPLAILILLSVWAGRAIGADASPSITDIKGRWVGEFHQDSHDTIGTFAMVLTVESVSGGEFSGLIDWPENDNRTKVEGALDGPVLKWTETASLRGDDVVLYGLYIGRINKRGEITGTWMDPKHTVYPGGPNYGTPGGTFVLRKAAP